jgi:hypothetical protein
MNKLEIAFSLFDTYNQQDSEILTHNGISYASEYFYALQLHRWVLELYPNASESLLLASRSQHIGRWEVKRNTYPEGRVGYLNWRSNLAKHHAEIANSLLLKAGYEGEILEDVKKIILKKGIKTDIEVQTIEDALCLVFLEFQFEDFSKKHEEDALIRILQKTWSKMSESGRSAALTLNYSVEAKEIILKALNK